MTLRACSRSLDLSSTARLGALAVSAFCFLVLSNIALAEVCDKAVGESWRPSDGPAWLLHPVGFPTGLTILTGWLALSVLVRKGELGLFGFAIIAIFFLLGLLPGDGDNSIHEAMLREGCTSERTEFWNTLVIGAFALAYLAAAIRAWRFRAKTI